MTLAKCSRHYYLVITLRNHGQMTEQQARVLDVLTGHAVSSRLHCVM
jgi:hypothetical protein